MTSGYLSKLNLVTDELNCKKRNRDTDIENKLMDTNLGKRVVGWDELGD